MLNDVFTPVEESQKPVKLHNGEFPFHIVSVAAMVTWQAKKSSTIINVMLPLEMWEAAATCVKAPLKIL